MTENISPLNELVAAMKSLPSTNQWDIVCSYTVAQLNQFLHAHYDAGKLAKIVELNGVTDLPFIGKTALEYKLEFDSPILTFTPNSAEFARLDMPINNGSFVFTPENTAFHQVTGSITPEKYHFVATIPIRGLKGDTLIPQGQVITFEENAQEVGQIVLHFTTEEGTDYSFYPELEGESDCYLREALAELKLYFQNKVDGVNYALASVNNTPPPSGLGIFTPKSFAFAAMPDGDQGALCLYIQTVESKNPAGNPSPSFQPGDKRILPIPSPYTASIILSYDLITRSFLKPQLESCGFDVSFINRLEKDGKTLQGGIFAQLSIMSGNKNIVFPKQEDRYNSGGLNYDWSVDGCSMLLEPLDISIQDGQITLKWHATANVRWDESKDDPESIYTAFNNGTVHIEVDLLRVGKLVVTNETITLADLQVAKSDFSLTVSQSENWWGQLPNRLLNSVKIDTYPVINIALHGFDFFRTTNLLAPGQHVIEVDSGVGVATPRDFLIVGQVVKQ